MWKVLYDIIIIIIIFKKAFINFARKICVAKLNCKLLISTHIILDKCLIIALQFVDRKMIIKTNVV